MKSEPPNITQSELEEAFRRIQPAVQEVQRVLLQQLAEEVMHTFRSPEFQQILRELNILAEQPDIQKLFRKERKKERYLRRYRRHAHRP